MPGVIALVHPSRQAAHVIPLHRMSGHGNDRETRPTDLFSVTNDARALEAVHLRQLDIHEHTAEPRKRLLIQNRERLAPLIAGSFLRASASVKPSASGI